MNSIVAEITALRAEFDRPEPETCPICGIWKASLMVLRTCDNCGSEYAGQAELDIAKKLTEDQL